MLLQVYALCRFEEKSLLKSFKLLEFTAVDMGFKICCSYNWAIILTGDVKNLCNVKKITNFMHAVKIYPLRNNWFDTMLLTNCGWSDLREQRFASGLCLRSKLLSFPYITNSCCLSEDI